MSIILSRQVITDSTAAVDAYISQAKTLYTTLEQTITQLTASGFIGDAADGYKLFFTTKIAPALTTNLTDGDASLMGALKKMMEEIGQQFLDNVDPTLGKANENAGQQAVQGQ